MVFISMEWSELGMKYNRIKENKLVVLTKGNLNFLTLKKPGQ